LPTSYTKFELRENKKTYLRFLMNSIKATACDIPEDVPSPLRYMQGRAFDGLFDMTLSTLLLKPDLTVLPYYMFPLNR
jgi:hypothetical protein